MSRESFYDLFFPSSTTMINLNTLSSEYCASPSEVSRNCHSYAENSELLSRVGRACPRRDCVYYFRVMIPVPSPRPFSNALLVRPHTPLKSCEITIAPYYI